MIGVTVTGERFRGADLVLYLVGVAGLAASLTLVFLSMRAVLDIGGACADGGPFVPRQPCPDGVPLLITGGIFGLFGFGGLMAWKGSQLGGPFGALVLLAWPALFLSLGWNFLEYAFWPPEPDSGVVWGWLIPGIVFVLMGGVPLLALLPPRGGRASRSPRAERAERARLLTRMVQPSDRRTADPDLVSQLERLAALQRDGALTELEFEQAKRRLLEEDGPA